MDLLRIFQTHGLPSPGEACYVFNGGMVDHGDSGVEIVVLALVLKLLWPGQPSIRKLVFECLCPGKLPPSNLSYLFVCSNVFPLLTKAKETQHRIPVDAVGGSVCHGIVDGRCKTNHATLFYII